MKRPLNSKYYIVILLCICLAGCGLTKGQKNGISAFGQATSTLGTTSKDQFQGSRENIIQMNKQRLAIVKKVLPEKQQDGKPETRDSYTKELDLYSGLKQENIEKRVDAIDLLVKYGNLLVAFSEDTQEKELTTASTQFTDSIKQFPGNPLSAEEITGLGQIVVVAGKMLVDYKKKEALKKIIPTVSPLITKICDALGNDFDLNNKGILQLTSIVQDQLANESIDGLKREGGSIGDRLILIDGLDLANQNKLAVETSSPKILKAIDSMRKANDNLTNLIKDDKVAIDDIKLFADNVNSLVKAIQPFMK
jgi:hypothetical protein